MRYPLVIARSLLTTAALLLAGFASAEDMYLQRWVADPAKSSLGFTATQEGAEFTGVFREFSSGMELMGNADTAVLQKVDATIQLGSVDTDYQDRDDENWLAHSIYEPQDKALKQRKVNFEPKTVPTFEPKERTY